MRDERASRALPILASDAERERSIALLREAVVEGRLTLAEFSERVDLAQAARTDQELAGLARDLPGDPAAAGPPAVASEEHRAYCSVLVRMSAADRGRWRPTRRGARSSARSTLTCARRGSQAPKPYSRSTTYSAR